MQVRPTDRALSCFRILVLDVPVPLKTPLGGLTECGIDL